MAVVAQNIIIIIIIVFFTLGIEDPEGFTIIIIIIIKNVLI